jgi:acyl carrier protein
MILRDKIEEVFLDVLEQTDSTLLVDKLTDDIVLLESGLDSLGFAILIATLEDELDYDPFTMIDEPIYPNTFGEFIDIYERLNPNK